MKRLKTFELGYDEVITLRNRPDGRFGVRGRVKNHVCVSDDGSVLLDFGSDMFPRKEQVFTDEIRSRRLLSELGDFVSAYAEKYGVPSPPYLDYVTDFVRVTYPDGGSVKFVIDDMNEAGMSALKNILNKFLSAFGLRLDVEEALPQGVFRYIQVVTEKTSKEYSYFWDGGDILPGEKVVVPFGAENEEIIGKVTSVEYYIAANVPYPIEKMKKIIQKTS